MKSLIDPRNKTSETRSIGGGQVDVIVAPRHTTEPHGLFAKLKLFFGATVALLKGMKLTFWYLSRPSTVVTQQYPENRNELKMMDRYRGQLRLTVDEDGHLNCNGCNFCEIACPNGSIIIESRKSEINNKGELDRFIWRLDSCTFCNACLQACPHEALEWSLDFEAAVFDRRLLVYNLNNHAGPQSKAMARARKKDENVQELIDSIKPLGQFEGPLPLAGTEMPGVHPLKKS